MFKTYDSSSNQVDSSEKVKDQVDEQKDEGNVKFGDNSKGKIIGIGNIGKTHSLVIEDVLLVVA